MKQRKYGVLGLALLLSACSPEAPVTQLGLVDNSGLFAAQFDQSGRLAVISGVSSPSGLYSINPFEQRFVWHLGGDKNTAFDAIAISNDGRVGVTLSATRLAVWNTLTGKNLQFVDLPKKPQHIALHPDGRWLLIQGVNQAILWDTQLGGAIRSFNFEQAISASTFNRLGSQWVVQLDDHQLVFLSVDSGKQLRQLALNKQEPSHLIADYEGVAYRQARQVTVLDDGGPIKLSFEKMQGAQQVTQLLKLANGEWVATTTTGKIAHWTADGQLIGFATINFDREWGTPATRVLALAEHNPNQLLLAGSRGEIVSLSLPFAR